MALGWCGGRTDVDWLATTKPGVLEGTTAIWLPHCVPKPLHQVLQQTAAALLVLRGFKPLAWPPLLSCIQPQMSHRC